MVRNIFKLKALMRDNGGTGGKYRHKENLPVTRQPYPYSKTVAIPVLVWCDEAIGFF
jgi:hypothetical protein